MNSPCEALTNAGVPCYWKAAATVVGEIRLCWAHEALFAEYWEHGGLDFARARVLAGVTYARARRAQQEETV